MKLDLILWPTIALAGIALGLFGSPYLLGVGFALCTWIALTQSWTILSAMTGYVSLGHVVFYGIGAYAMVLLFGTVPIPIALLIAALGSTAFAVFIGLPALRVRGPYFVILTFGLAELVKHLVIQVESALGAFSRVIFGAPPLETLYAGMFALALAATALAVMVRRSRFGAGLLAIRENEGAAQTLGVAPAKMKLAAFALSAAIPGAVGALATLRTTYFEPAQVFDPAISFSIVTMAIVGGSDDARGPVIGSIAFVALSEMLWARLPQLYMVVLGLALIAFVLFLPKGLAGSLFGQRERGNP